MNIHDSTVSPINGDLIGLARTSIFIGTSDLLEPDCMKFYKLAKDKNVMVDLHRYQGLCHDFMMFGFLEESKSVLQRVISLINQ